MDMFTEASITGNRRSSYMTKTPCRTLERINYDVQTAEAQEEWNDTTVALDFTEFTYKEVKNVRGMDIQALIGTIFLSYLKIRHRYQI